jgi:hypothetical protein
MFTFEVISEIHIPYYYSPHIGSYLTRRKRKYFQPNGGELFKYFTSLPCWHLSPVKEGLHWQVLSFRHWPPFSQSGLHSAEK